MLLFFGRRYERRGSSSGCSIAIHAVLGSLALSWTITYGSGIVIPLPAWPLFASEVAMWISKDPTWHRENAIPPHWLSIAAAICAYLVGAIWARSTGAPVLKHSIGDDLTAIKNWLGIWLLSRVVIGGVTAWALDPPARSLYRFGVVVYGVLAVSPVGLVCSMFFLLAWRRVRLFHLCAVPVGFAAALWPLLLLLGLWN